MLNSFEYNYIKCYISILITNKRKNKNIDSVNVIHYNARSVIFMNKFP